MHTSDYLIYYVILLYTILVIANIIDYKIQNNRFRHKINDINKNILFKHMYEYNISNECYMNIKDGVCDKYNLPETKNVYSLVRLNYATPEDLYTSIR